MPTTTIKWNRTGQTYVHSIIGDDFNGNGSKDRPFQSWYRAVVKGGTIIAIGPTNEFIPSLNDNIAIYADSPGAAWYDGERKTGVGGAVSNHAGIEGDNESGNHIYGKQIYDMLYLRSRVPVGYGGVGSDISGAAVGGGSLLVDSFAFYGTGSGNHCAFIYPKFNANTNSNAQMFSSRHSSYDYSNRQTFVGVHSWRRDINCTKKYCVFDDCTIPVIFANAFAVTFNHCAFRNCKFTIPAAYAVGGVDLSITTEEIIALSSTDKSHSDVINEWIAANVASTYKVNIYETCVMLRNSDSLFRNLRCVWRDADTGEIVDAANSANAYIEPELSTFDISIADDSPAVPYLSEFGAMWHGSPSLDYKMAIATDLLINEDADGDLQLTGNLTIKEDEYGKKYITYDKDINDSTIVDDFKGGLITTRPRLVPHSQLFRYPKIHGQWANSFMAEKERGTQLFGRNITLTATTVTFDNGESLTLDADRLWLKDTPSANELTAGYRYFVKSGTILLYNSTSMVWIEYNTGAIINTIAGDIYFFKILTDDTHLAEQAELIECLPNNNNEYDVANRVEIRLFNSAEVANEYNSKEELLDEQWIPLQLLVDQVVGIHYYDLPQNDIVWTAEKGYMISQNPNINDTAYTIAVHQQDPSDRYDVFAGDSVADKDQGVYTKTQTKSRPRYAFSPLNETLVYAQLRFKVVPFTDNQVYENI